MMMRGSTYLWIAVALGLATLPVCGRASVHGQCSNCHTMHNSQNNQPMTFSAAGYTTSPNPGGSATPHDELVRGTCLQCHTGDNNGGSVPFVYTTSSGGPTYTTYDSAGNVTGGNTLAGGNFYWCVHGGAGGTGDVAVGGGHNVDMLGAIAGPLTSPPGYSDTPDWATRVGDQTDMVNSGHLTCAGTAGCHGNRTKTNNYSAMYGAHHTPNTGNTRDGSTVGTSYRFLLGIKGIEDPDWEYTVSVGDHNEYYGVARTANDSDVTGTISHLCAECHGAFHNDSGFYTGVQGILPSSATTMASPWIRHPTDFDMNGLGGEYANYGGSGTNAYVPAAPVASDDLTKGVLSTVLQTSGDAIVTCISCHRAHGSPYASLLRWNYKAWPGTGGYNGCAICHTTKN